MHIDICILDEWIDKYISTYDIRRCVFVCITGYNRYALTHWQCKIMDGIQETALRCECLYIIIVTTNILYILIATKNNKLSMKQKSIAYESINKLWHKILKYSMGNIEQYSWLCIVHIQLALKCSERTANKHYCEIYNVWLMLNLLAN